MDPLSSPSFSNVPLTQPIVISHYISMVIAFLGCYPLLLTQQIRRHKRVITFLSILFTLAGFISGQFIKTANNLVSVVWRIVSLFLIFLVLNQFVLAAYRYSVTEKQTFVYRLYPRWFSKIPLWIDIVLGWMILIIAITYLVIAGQVFTESCLDQNTQGQCLIPISMGTGFLLYGTLALLHLLSIIKIPRPSTPEYYEGLILIFWGVISLIMARTPILGNEWRAINLGLLWFAGGVFSVSLSLQTWIPALRERNIVNSIVIFLTGRAIAISITDNDKYTSTIYTMLGNILVFGALARIIQILFRKSPVDNLPRRMFQNINDSNFEDEEEGDEITTTSSLQQKCKHRALFASITLVSGLSASILSIGGGFLFIGANVGWIQHMKYYIPDPITYINVILAVSFLWCVYVFGLCTLYIHLRRQNNVLHQYQELETTTNDLNITPIATTIVSERDRWSSIPLTSLSTNEYIASSPTEISTPLLQEEAPTSPIPLTNTITTKKINTNTDNNSYNNEESPKSAEKSMRPSEYRAKRRSLLVQSSLMNSQATESHPYHSRPRPLSGISVGGILPDEITHNEAAVTSSSFRRSWRSSSGSSIGYSIDSSAPSSPPLPADRRFISTSQRPPRNSLDEELHRFDEEIVYIGEQFKSDMPKRKA